MFQAAAASSSAGSGDDDGNHPPPSPSHLLPLPPPSPSEFPPPSSPSGLLSPPSPYNVIQQAEEERKKIQQREDTRLEFLKKTVEMKNESQYWFKKWEMKQQGEEVSELERAPMMTEEELEIWAKEEEEEAEAKDGKVWDIEEKISYWEEQHVHFVMESKYWELRYEYLGLSD
ncbi:unnamed protein product [Arabidopsis arenosa]|uniref:Uncharacterized protein n=1 Tax=Arabidopsis arenosa TaxID=38785 RepID=A0A8S2AJH7_ARAAE|nr:unnamed protein product [Arabidopsis arenosa]